MRYFTFLASLLFVLAVPVFLVTVSVAVAFNAPPVYNRGFAKYHIAALTGIGDADLRQVGADLRAYFNSRAEPLDVQTRIYGVEQPLFNQREVAHMRDVKRLLWGGYGLLAASGLYLLVGSGLLAAWRRQRGVERVAWLGLWGAGLTVGLVMLVGLLAVAGFDKLFLFFHQVSFANDLWQLDPRTDYLVQLFPLPFWFDATLWVGALTLAGAALVAGATGGYLLYRRWASRASPTTPRRRLGRRPDAD